MERRTAAAIVAVLALLAAACGQKPGVSEGGGAVALTGGVVVDPTTGAIVDPETGEIIDPDTGEIIPGDTAGDDLVTGSSDDAGGDGGGGGGSSDDGGPRDEPEPGEPTGGDSTGVTDEVIKIGVHAPITGAAPVPSDSAVKGSQVYWRWLERNGKRIFGRRVEVVIKNDQYNPSHAVAVCKEMVEKDRVFLITGAAGTDQIQACARYTASVGVPYISAGVTEVAVSSLPNYFTQSMTYPDQGPLMADFLIERLGAVDEANAIVYANTANFLDGKDAFVDAMESRGAEVYERAVSKSAGASDAQAVVTDLNQRGIENVNLLMPPVFFLQMLQAARGQNYWPQWVAPGIQMTFDAVASVGCRNGTLDKAKMFSPFPAWIDSNKFDPDFRRAVREIYPEEGEGDDFMWLGWSAMKGIHSMFELPGENLTRERFIWFLERSDTLFNGIGPHLDYSPENHLGADEVHVSEARCGQGEDNRWHTMMTWVSDF